MLSAVAIVAGHGLITAASEPRIFLIVPHDPTPGSRLVAIAAPESFGFGP